MMCFFLVRWQQSVIKVSERDFNICFVCYITSVNAALFFVFQNTVCGYTQCDFSAVHSG